MMAKGAFIMAQRSGVVRVHEEDRRALTFQVEGQGTMRQGQAMRHVAEEWLGRGAGVIRVDLRRCTYMDSTCIGTLLMLRREATAHGGRFELVCPSGQCVRLLGQMGLGGMFAVVEEEERPGDWWREVQAIGEETGVDEGNVVEAHEELARLPGATGEAFRALAERLEKERGGRDEGE